MFCINCYLWEYIGKCLSGIDSQFPAHKNRARPEEASLQRNHRFSCQGIESFKRVFLNKLVLSHIFRHKNREAEGKDVHSPDKVEVSCHAVMHHADKPCENEVMKVAPDKSVLRFKVGNEIKFGEEGFVNIYKAFFPENKRN